MVLYVGNLPYSASEQDIRTLFESYGSVESVKLIVDKDTGKKKGYGFIEMSDEEAQVAIDNLNHKDYGGRNLKVNEAKQRPNEGSDNQRTRERNNFGRHR